MSLVAAFEDAARAHFASPPATWRIQPGPGGWNIVDLHGAVLDTCATLAHAEECRHSGPAAQRWHRRTDWYLGYDDAGGGRALTQASLGTYRADQLDFQDEQAAAEFRAFLYELITGKELATAD